MDTAQYEFYIIINYLCMEKKERNCSEYKYVNNYYAWLSEYLSKIEFYETNENIWLTTKINTLGT